MKNGMKLKKKKCVEKEFSLFNKLHVLTFMYFGVLFFMFNFFSFKLIQLQTQAAKKNNII